MSETPIDYTDPVQQVRLLIADVSTDPAKRILADEQLAGYLTINVGSVKRAAADALDAIASSEALVSKVIRTQDLQTDGSKVADALRKHADSLRTQADALDDFAFDVVYPPSSLRPELIDRPIAWGL